MKKMLSMILLAGVLTGPVFSADVNVPGLTAMAQENSGVSIDKLSLAVYDAVKAQPDKAADIFRSVMSQRSSWSVTDTYAVLRSVLLASPSLEASFVQGVASYQGGSYDASVVTSSGYQLVTALFTMAQTQSVASAVAQGVVGSAVSGRSAGNGVSQSALEAYVPEAPVSPEYSVTPTPPPTSANN